VLILTRDAVLDVRALVTVAELTTTVRGHAAEVAVDHVEVGLSEPSVVNCDGLHTIAQRALTGPVGRLDDTTMQKVCGALNHALAC
jgi:mRNA-degrading endonuclease toxin of MazEF toxin-antitoxin module